MFCKSCGQILLPQKTPYGKWLSCPSGHQQPELNQTAEIISTKNKDKTNRLSVASDENILAVHDHACQRCGYGKAEMLEIGSFYSDEDSVVKMKCGKCGHVEQLAGKIT
jgi:DNA-directed RNA polymerase subunit M/transcription elongation factor TFIIS